MLWFIEILAIESLRDSRQSSGKDKISLWHPHVPLVRGVRRVAVLSLSGHTG